MASPSISKQSLTSIFICPDLEGAICLLPGTASPHFSPAFYCGVGSGHVYSVALGRAPRHTVEYSCGALDRAPCIHARLRRLATKPGEKCGLEASLEPPATADWIGMNVETCSAKPDLQACFEAMERRFRSSRLRARRLKAGNKGLHEQAGSPEARIIPDIGSIVPGSAHARCPENPRSRRLRVNWICNQ
jgi:hypothetical protein